MKLSETIRKIDCSGNLSLKVAMFEIADAVDSMEQDHANAVAATIKLMDENHALAAELAALREQEPVLFETSKGYISAEEVDAADFELLKSSDLYVKYYAGPVCPTSITDAELKLIMDMRRTKENYEAGVRQHHEGVEYLGRTVFAGPKEDFKDWPEDRGFHPQRGVAK